MTSNLPAWTAIDAAALPLPSGVPGGPGGVVAILATDSAFEAGWAAGCAVALARAWASAGLRVVLADLNLQRPTLHQEVRLPNGEGLSDILLWGASVRRAAQGVEEGGFYLISAGTAVADPASAMASRRWGPLCDGFRDAGVALVVFLRRGNPVREAVLARASEVVIVAPEDEDVGVLVGELSPPVSGVVGQRGVPKAPVVVEEEPAVAAEEEPAVVAAAPEEKAAVAAEEEPAVVAEAPEEEAVLAQEEPAATAEAPEEEPAATAEEEPAAAAEAPEEEAAAAEEPLVFGDLHEEEPAPVQVAAGSDAPAPAAQADESPAPMEREAAAGVAEAEAAPRVPPLEEVLQDAGAVVERPSGKRRSSLLLLLLLVIVLGAIVAAMLGYIHIPGISALSAAGASPSAGAGHMAAAFAHHVTDIPVHAPAVDGHAPTLSVLRGSLPV